MLLEPPQTVSTLCSGAEILSDLVKEQVTILVSTAYTWTKPNGATGCLMHPGRLLAVDSTG